MYVLYPPRVLCKIIVRRKCGRSRRLPDRCAVSDCRGEEVRKAVEGDWRAVSHDQEAKSARPPIVKEERPNPASGGLPIIMVQQPAQSLAALYRAFGDLAGRFQRRQYTWGRQRTDPGGPTPLPGRRGPETPQNTSLLANPAGPGCSFGKNRDQLTLARLFALTAQPQVRRRFLSVFRGPKEYRTR